MKQKINKTEIIFYQKLGELFYAIAAADKVVKAEEYNALTKLITDDWNVYKNVNDFYNEAEGYQIEFVFNALENKEIDAKTCFSNFKNYARKEPKLFTKETIELILKTTNTIASAFSSKNKSELIMLANLKLLFQEDLFK